MMLKRLVQTLLLLLLATNATWADIYYVDSEKGNDNNIGTSKTAPWKGLNRVRKLKPAPGDQILFAAGKEFKGNLVLHGLKGTYKKPIIISSYSDGSSKDLKRAIINAKGSLNGIYLQNSSFVKVKNLVVTADAGGVPEWAKNYRKKQKKKGKKLDKLMRIGVYVEAVGSAKVQHITLDNLLVQDIFFAEPGVKRSKKETRSANGTESYGYGIRVTAKNKASIHGIQISNSIIHNVGHTGIKFKSSKKIRNVTLQKNRVYKTGGPGIQMSGVIKAQVVQNIVRFSGSSDDSRKWGRGSGMWTWGSDNISVLYNKFLDAQGPADSAGFHVDFNCKNVIFQYNLTANNAGGFIEILGNNHNSAYRYNISVNDGYRIKKQNGATQQGKTFWLSGFVGKDRKRHGPYNSYIYNNTIYVDESVLSKVSVTKGTSGAFIANNIFHVVGNGKDVLGDQYRPEDPAGKNDLVNILFKNNLFLHAKSWPKETLIQDASPRFGDAQFMNPGGRNHKDYIPQNTKLVKNKGIHIERIKGDKVGLVLGLKVKRDILGNKIVGRPDMGAIEVQ